MQKIGKLRALFPIDIDGLEAAVECGVTLRKTTWTETR